MYIPAVVLLGLYCIIVVILCVLAGFNVYHMIKYAFRTTASIVLTVVFCLLFIAVLIISGVIIVQLDWSTQFTLFSV